MDENARAARREYYRQWRAANPEKVDAAQERYWLKKAAAIQARAANVAADPGREHEKEQAE